MMRRRWSDWIGQHAGELVVVVLVVLVSVVRLRIADIPLERDEGEYAYAGRLILDGLPPYQLAFNMKFPGIYYAYGALLAIFGDTPRGIRVGLMVANGATILLLFLLARRLLQSSGAAAVAACFFGVLSIDQWVLGVFGHATHFVVLASIAGLLAIVRALDRPRSTGFLLLGGSLLGVAVLMKQNGAFFFAFGILLAFADVFRGDLRGWRAAVVRSGAVAIGGAIPIALVGVILFEQGAFEKFWFWTVDYAQEYVSEVSVAAGWDFFKLGFSKITQVTAPIWVLGAVGLPALWLARWPDETRLVITGLLGVSALSICPGLYFRSHYFILALPVVAILAAVAVESVRRLPTRVVSAAVARVVAIALPVLAIGDYVRQEWRYLAVESPSEIGRTRYGLNPFEESIEVARYIAQRSKPDDRVAVLGSEPQIYFYSRRMSATGFIYMYPLMEEHRFAERMQKEMIGEIEAVHPEFVVFVAVPTSWQASTANEPVLAWADRYLAACYEQVGIVEVNRPDETRSAWDEDLEGFVPRSPYAMLAFRRTSDLPCTGAS